ncbi:MAG: circularly permuted type 2 ATP-grasp protein [Steroidobacteraceae bacterium]
MATDTTAALEPGPPRYDELNDPRSGLRPHWRELIGQLHPGSTGAIRRAHELTRRLIVENGVTYNVYSDPQGADRPWALDPLPFLLPDHEWRLIEAGVAQRCTLLNALLADLYGPQRLIAEGLVPTALPFGHPNFLWPCQGLKPADGTWLHLYAADLARAPDGRWWLLADRTQAPSGAGYTLENREIIEQVHAEVLPAVGVRRVHGFFDGLRQSLLHSDSDTAPLAVILTPGPFNETYFEHVYLARQLGIPLVEGSDLTVRGDVLYLKTLAGLQRVRTIFRRLDDDFCDPLELRGDSTLGVPGLLGALRAGNAVVANALGSGVLESAAWLGFLPAVSERLLGERLLLPEVATWWCGEQPALEYVLANLDHLVIKPAYPNQHFEPIFGRNTLGTARERLVSRLRHRPYAYVAQEHVQLSQAPVWQGAQGTDLGARALTIRVYAFTTRDGVRVMPGGLARIAQQDAADVVSAQRGGGAKDIWVLSDGRAEPAAAPAGAPEVRRNDIPSRLVENLYWLGRYGVRCDNHLRLLRSALAARGNSELYRHALGQCVAFDAVAKDTDAATALSGPGDAGIAADIRRLASSASQVRNRLSIRYWRGVIALQRQLQDAASSNRSPREQCEHLLLQLAALAGYCDTDMTRDEGWHAMQLGRAIERAQFLAAILDAPLASRAAARPEALEWLLDVCDSLATYRRSYAGTPHLPAVLALLLGDPRQPHSLAFQSLRIHEHLAALLPDIADPQWQLAPLPAPSMDPAALREALRAFEASTGRMSDRLSARFFMHIDVDTALSG